MALPVPFRKTGSVRSHLWVEFRQGGRTVGGAVSHSGQVRWGPAIGIEFTFPVSEVKRWEELFRATRRGVRLPLREAMSGEVRVGDSWLRLEDLEEWGLARGRRGRRWLQLTPAMEGEFRYRGLEVSFRFGGSPEPSAASAPRWGRVPLRFRRGMLSREEWPFAIFTWSLYGVLMYLTLSLSSLELPEATRPEQVAPRFARLIYESPQAPTPARAELLRKAEEAAAEEAIPEEEKPAEPEPEEEAVPKPEPEAAVLEPEVVEPAPPLPGTPTESVAETEPGPDPARRREELREKVSKKGLLGLLGGRGSAATAGRTRGSILAGSGAAADLDRVLEKVEGLRSAQGGGGDGLGDGTGPGGGIDDAARRVASAGRRAVQVEQREQQVVEAKEQVSLDELTLKDAVAAIHRAVGTYLGGIRYLYNRELRRTPDLEGKLTVRITVSPEGEVLDCEVVESTLDSPELVSAVLKRVKKWSLPAVAPRPITVTYPFVFFPSM